MFKWPKQSLVSICCWLFSLRIKKFQKTLHNQISEALWRCKVLVLFLTGVTCFIHRIRRMDDQRSREHVLSQPHPPRPLFHLQRLLELRRRRGSLSSHYNCIYHAKYAKVKFCRADLMQGALLDYPATIDYIVATTGYDDLHFVGYSMGTTQYLMLLSEMPGK